MKTGHFLGIPSVFPRANAKGVIDSKCFPSIFERQKLDTFSLTFTGRTTTPQLTLISFNSFVNHTQCRDRKKWPNVPIVLVVKSSKSITSGMFQCLFFVHSTDMENLFVRHFFHHVKFPIVNGNWLSLTVEHLLERQSRSWPSNTIHREST